MPSSINRNNLSSLKKTAPLLDLRGLTQAQALHAIVHFLEVHRSKRRSCIDVSQCSPKDVVAEMDRMVQGVLQGRQMRFEREEPGLYWIRTRSGLSSRVSERQDSLPRAMAQQRDSLFAGLSRTMRQQGTADYSSSDFLNCLDNSNSTDSFRSQRSSCHNFPIDEEHEEQQDAPEISFSPGSTHSRSTLPPPSPPPLPRNRAISVGRPTSTSRRRSQREEVEHRLRRRSSSSSASSCVATTGLPPASPRTSRRTQRKETTPQRPSQQPLRCQKTPPATTTQVTTEADEDVANRLEKLQLAHALAVSKSQFEQEEREFDESMEFATRASVAEASSSCTEQQRAKSQEEQDFELAMELSLELSSSSLSLPSSSFSPEGRRKAYQDDCSPTSSCSSFASSSSSSSPSFKARRSVSGVGRGLQRDTLQSMLNVARTTLR